MPHIKIIREDVKIQPNGFIESIVFEAGDSSWCGDEKLGMGIYITKHGKYAPGGVLKRTDMEKLIKIFQEHLANYPISPSIQ